MLIFFFFAVAARNAGPNSPNNVNSTLNRPMASQGGTRYEDRTISRPHAGPSGFRTARVRKIFFCPQFSAGKKNLKILFLFFLG